MMSSRTVSSAKRKLIAVGRVSSSSACACASPASLGSAASAIARPYAAVVPIIGAPRVHISRIATAASSALRSSTHFTSQGSLR